MQVCIYDEEGDSIEIDVPSKKEQCDNCDGNGRHIHNAFREEAFTEYDAEREGLDFEEEVYNMQSGMYDVTCDDCCGTGQIDVVDFSQVDEELEEKIREYQYDQACFEAEARAERESEARMMGWY